MKHSADEIENSERYTLLLELPYYDIVPFLVEYIKKYTPVIISGIIILAIMVSGLIIMRIGIAGDYPFGQILTHSLLGAIVIPALLILPHELLHIIPYYLSGARDIRIRANWREAYFFVTAHRHVISRRWFIPVAITPALVITIMLVTVAFFVSPLWQWSIACAIVSHYTMCAGDLALLNYFHIHRKNNIVTWDDTEKGLSYFYRFDG